MNRMLLLDPQIIQDIQKYILKFNLWNSKLLLRIIMLKIYLILLIEVMYSDGTHYC